MRKTIIALADSAAALATLAAAVALLPVDPEHPLPYVSELERIADIGASAVPMSYSDRLTVVRMVQTLYRRGFAGMVLPEALIQGEKLAVWGSLVDPLDTLAAGVRQTFTAPAVLIEDAMVQLITALEDICGAGYGDLLV